MKTGPPSPAVKLAARNLLVRSGGSDRRLGYKDIPGPRSFPLIGNILGYRAPDVGRSVRPEISQTRQRTHILWS